MFKYEKDVRESTRILTISEKVPWTLLRLRRVIVIYEALLAKTLVSGYDLFTIVNSYTYVRLLKAFLSIDVISKKKINNFYLWFSIWAKFFIFF